MTNRSSNFTAQFEFDECQLASVGWLDISPVKGVIPPLNVITIHVANNHALSTVQLSEEMEKNKQFDRSALPLLGSHLATPQNDLNMEIHAVVKVVVSYPTACSILSEDGQEHGGKVPSQTLSIPITCSMATD